MLLNTVDMDEDVLLEEMDSGLHMFLNESSAGAICGEIICEGKKRLYALYTSVTRSSSSTTASTTIDCIL